MYNIARLRSSGLRDRMWKTFKIQWYSRTLARRYFQPNVGVRQLRREFLANHKNIYETYCHLERRVEHVLFRSMFAASIYDARKLASDGHILINDRPSKGPNVMLKDGTIPVEEISGIPYDKDDQKRQIPVLSGFHRVDFLGICNSGL